MPVISFASSKGGAGKTTAAIVLGTELAEGTSVIMIDADPAKRLVRWSALAPLSDNLEVLASGGERTIQSEIDEAKTKAAFIISNSQAPSPIWGAGVCEVRAVR